MTQQKGFFGPSGTLAIIRNVVALAALLLTAACGGGGDTTAPPPPPPGTPAIKIQNNSSHTITAVFYSTCSSTVFGDDRLAGAIGPNSSQTFTADVTSGCYNVAVRDDANLVHRFPTQTVSDGTATVEVPNEGWTAT